VTGWYGAACDRPCDCFRHVALKNALEISLESADAQDVLLETVPSQSGYAIQPHGTCQRDGTCKCYDDPDGSSWTGKDRAWPILLDTSYDAIYLKEQGLENHTTTSRAISA